MKRVTLTDDPAGNALGWDPSGTLSFFDITEPAITTNHGAFVDIFVTGLLDNCEVNAVFDLGIFRIICENPPASGAELHYVVENLPAHVF
jgi:hypothetical protein